MAMTKSAGITKKNQGLTKHIQYGLVKKKTIFGLKSQVQYLNIPWAMHDSNEYIKAIGKKSVDKSHNKVECRIITAKLVVLSNQVVQQSLVPFGCYCSSVNTMNSNWPKKISNDDLRDS
jgi:hypothetical protein